MTADFVWLNKSVMIMIGKISSVVINPHVSISAVVEGKEFVFQCEGYPVEKPNTVFMSEEDLVSFEEVIRKQFDPQGE